MNATQTQQNLPAYPLLKKKNNNPYLAFKLSLSVEFLLEFSPSKRL